MIAEDVPVVFGMHRSSYVLTQGWLQNYNITDLTIGNAKYWGVDLALKEQLLEKF